MNIFFKVEANPVEMRCQCFYSAVMANSKLDYYFVASYITLVYSSVAFHIYPYLRGNSIPSDRNYRSAVVTIWSAVKRGRLNLGLVFVWRHTAYDYMTYN